MGLVKENAGRITYSMLWKCFACVLGKLNANPSKSCRVALSQRIRQAVSKQVTQSSTFGHLTTGAVNMRSGLA